MTLIIGVAAFLMGFALALLLRESATKALLSRSQERMQRKVRYWTSEAVHARDLADRLYYQFVAHTGHEPEPPDWPPLASG
jgi:hypothetical protein